MELKDFKVGQVWRQRDGQRKLITDIWLELRCYPIRSGEDGYTVKGHYYEDSEESPRDLVELIQDVDEPPAQTRLDAQLADAMQAPRGATAAELALFDAIVVASTKPADDLTEEFIYAVLRLRRKLEQDISQ